jgi:hypothetical protein
MTSGSKVTKRDLIALARALGDGASDEDLAGESMTTILARCLERAYELGAKADPFEPGPTHPKVREWCAAVMDYCDERLEVYKSSGDTPGEAEKWRWYTAFAEVRENSGRPCEHNFDKLSNRCTRRNCRAHIDEIAVDPNCRHQFQDTKHCLMCGVSANILHAKARRELELFQAQPPSAADELRAKAESINEAIGAVPGAVDAHEWDDIKRACGEPNRLAPPSTTELAGGEPLVSFVLVEELSTERRQNAEQWAQTEGSRGRLPPA